MFILSFLTGCYNLSRAMIELVLELFFLSQMCCFVSLNHVNAVEPLIWIFKKLKREKSEEIQIELQSRIHSICSLFGRLIC